MTQEQIVKKYQITKAEDLLQEILVINKRLYIKWANEYCIKGYDLEDMIQEAHVVTLRALESYEEGKGVLFTSYLKRCVYQQYNRLYNYQHRDKRGSGSEPLSWEELEDVNKEFSIEWDPLSNVALKEFISSLEGTTQEIAISLSYGCSKSQIAQQMKIKPSSVTYYIKRIRSQACKYYDTCIEA